MKKIIEIDDKLIIKLKILSAFENLSVKALIEKAVERFVSEKEMDRFNSMSDEEKEDLGLLLLMQQVNKKDIVSEDVFLKALHE